MTCTGIQRLFDAYWDDETTQAEREFIEAHFAACPTCRERYEEFARTLETLAALPRVEAAPELLERVTTGAARIARAPDRLPAAPTPVWVPVAAAAVVVVMGVFALMPWMAQRDGRIAANARSNAAAVHQPELVQVAGRAAVRGAHADAPARASSAQVAAVTDSLFDHSVDVEFVLDPVAVRHHPTGATRSVHGVEAERAVISF